MSKKIIIAAAMVAGIVSVFADSNPEQEFTAAVKAGKPLTAERAFKQLIEKNPNASAEIYYQAAQVSQQLLKGADRRDRMAHLLRADKSWNPKTAQAAAIVALETGDAEAFKRLFQNRKSDFLVGEARGWLWKFRDQRRPKEVLALVDAALEVFTTNDQRNQILEPFYYVLGDNPAGLNNAAVKALMEKHYQAETCYWGTRIMEDRFDRFGAAYVADHMLKNKKVYSRWLLEDGLGGRGLWNRNYKVCTNTAQQVAFMRKIRPLEQFCVDSMDKSLDAAYSAKAWVYWRTQLPQAFIDGKSPADTNKCYLTGIEIFKKLCATKFAKENMDFKWRLRDVIGNYFGDRIGACCVGELAKLRNEYADYLHNGNLMWGYNGPGYTDDKAKKCDNIMAIIKKHPDRTWLRTEGLRQIASFGSSTEALKIMEDYLLCNPTSFDTGYILDLLNRMEKVTPNEKAAWIKKMVGQVGYSKRWDAFAGKDWQKNVKWIGDKAFDSARQEILKKNVKAGNKLVALRREIEGMKEWTPRMTQIAEEALKEYKGDLYPTNDEEKVPVAMSMVAPIINKFADLAYRKKDAYEPFIKTVLPRVGKNFNKWWNFDRIYYDGIKKAERSSELAWAKVKQAGDINALSGVRLAKDAKEMPKEYEYTKMTDGGSLAYFVWENRDKLPLPERAEWVSKELLMPVFVNYSEDWQRNLLGILNDLAGATNTVHAKIPYEELAKAYIDKPGARYTAMQSTVELGVRCGKRVEAFKHFLGRMDQEDPLVRLGYYFWIVDNNWILTDYNNTTNKIVDLYGPFLKSKLVPLMKSIPNQDAMFISMPHGHWLMDRLVNYGRNHAKDPEVQAWVGEFYEQIARFEQYGARGAITEPKSLAYNHTFRKAFKNKDMVGMANTAVPLARTWGGWIGWHAEYSDLCRNLASNECWEALFLLTDNLATDNSGMQSIASQMRAKAAPKLPGIYPVSESDPSYPLYVAADELARNNPERAWDLLQKSVAVFERVAIKLPPNFTAWAVERLRMARGDKDSLLKKARDIASQLLTDESKLTPELAAAMMLVRAESYRDQQNFEAAKLEYQSIRNNPKYNATPSGRKAMFRSVGLMIDMGNASAAESTLEYWLSQPDADIQAEAHYFLARIAFERQDYEETIKQLRETFAIDFTHTEARFLHGKWKLATNSEVDDTDVMIGDLKDRTVIRPGQQLTITVQDRNLSVAGGGASIPVIVTTAPGGDSEKVQLYPSARDPNLFKGIVDVKLGAPKKNNMQLEVNGKDTATYVIDPEFLKARGLPITAGKSLRVVDDAKLEIENEDIRPGNPLYVMVEDKDRSMGGDSKVPITIKTSSGDILKGFELKETAAYSGKFKGEIPTSLPPPRAFASDTSVGFNAGDAINSTKDKPWKSLADSKPGKWIEVDTMGSHLVKRAKVFMPSLETVQEIALVGRLGTETIRLGSLPEEPVERRLGLKWKMDINRGQIRSESAMRAHFGALNKRDYYSGVYSNEIAFTHWEKKNPNAYRAQNIWYSGAFVAPKDVNFVRLKIVAKRTQGRTFANLWLAIAVDGESVFQGQGPTLHNRIVSFDIASGAHQLEIFASAGRLDDSFDIMIENEGEEAKPFPMGWFSAQQHPELKDYLKSRAVISRTNDCFVANFERPMRLRSLRWEFVKRTTPDVTVEKLEVENSKGEKVIPVTSDYSDAQINNTLEVAPGDVISVQYNDDITSGGEKRVLEKTVKSSFNNARVGFYFEALEKTKRGYQILHCYNAFRFQTGDNLLVGVFDPDMDSSSAADKISVTVKSSSGESQTVTLVETDKNYAEINRHWERDEMKQREGVHSGMFLGLLRTVDADSTNAVKRAMKVKSGDSLTMSYMDRENTSPGVPFARTAKVQCVKKGEAAIQLFHTRKVREIDRSARAKAKLEKIRRRPGNEKVVALYRDVQIALPMTKQLCNSTGLIDVNVATPIPVRVVDPTRAKHNGSKVLLEAISESEIAKAKEEDREPAKVTIPLPIAGLIRDFSLQKGGESAKEARQNGSFNGVLELCLGPINTEKLVHEDAAPQLSVTGSDVIHIKILDADDKKVLLERKLRFVSNASLALMDSTWNAERLSAHVGERFYISVDDADRDASDEVDHIKALAKSLATGATNVVDLVETLPHSGVFTGTMPTTKYGDKIVFSYRDALTLPGTPVRTLCTTGEVFAGSDGAVRMFSKRFRDTDNAVLVQFRLAECLFEQAKEHRKLKQADRAQTAIDQGKHILEEALKNYPDSSHVVQGEYLLANLYQELAQERKDAKDMDHAIPLYSEALSRFSAILAAWPDSEYGSKSQYHKALCLEMLGDYPRASEEYVKMTYLYPESELVGDATIRLATYYYKHEKRYDTAGRIYENFQKRFPTHEKAPRTLFMSGSCYIKQAEKEQKKFEEQTKRTDLCKRSSDLYESAAKSFASVAETYRETASPDMRAQALYWAGDAYLRRRDYRNSYIFLKRTVFEYPETEWARRARGLILQESAAFDGLERQ